MRQQEPGPIMAQSEPEQPVQRGSPIFGRVIFLLICLVVGLIVLQSLVYRLKAVYVIGNERMTAEQIVMLSGLTRGQSIFSVNEEEVSKNLTADHRVIFNRMVKDYPNTVYLYITERSPVAVVQHLGIQYTIDSQGLVMEESHDLMPPEGLPFITGLQIMSLHVGQELMLRNKNRLDAYKAVIAELKLQLYADEISELNLSNMDSLYLVTVDGMTVRLGKGQEMRAKVGALRTYIAYLRQEGKSGGVLDVSIPEDAKYTPGD